MSKKRYEWIFQDGENEIIDNLTGQYVTISSPELLNEKDQKIADLEAKLAESEKEITDRMVAFEKRCQEYYKSKVFTIEQLEKLKEVCSQVWGMEYAVEAIEDHIDNQIKQLKEME